MIHIFSHICGQNDHIVALMRKKGEKRIDVMGCDVTRLGCRHGDDVIFRRQGDDAEANLIG
jgi:hypothetical protein